MSKKNLPTLESLMKDLEQVKRLSMANGSYNSMINAIALQAKLLGLDDPSNHKPTQDQRPTQIIIDVKDGRKPKNEPTEN